jgi:hypothetical protein
MLIAIMCVSIISIPISAADRSSDTLDAVAGSRNGSFQLLTNSSGSANDICASASKGGKISASASSSVSGKTVYVHVQPDKGYEMASIFVITSSGDSVEIHIDDGVYNFVMPEEQVVIDVTFQLKHIS